MKERPIIFSAPMVRAILDGSKTQTRRVVKPQPSGDWRPEVGAYHPTQIDRHGEEYPGAEVFGASDEREGRICPYGRPGDRLWVREAVWLPRPVASHDLREGADTWPKCVYSADTDEIEIEWLRDMRWKQRPSIHMPRWAGRILLEVTEVRVQRLLEITDADVTAAGAITSKRPDAFSVHSCIGVDGKIYLTPRGAYVALWDAINGKGAAALHPWVWAVSFKRITPA